VPIRIVHADDHPIVRKGCRAILEREGFLVVAEAADGREAIQLTTLHQPDVALLDLRMPYIDGLDAARAILEVRPSTAIVMLTIVADAYHVVDALRAGVRSYVTKSQVTAELAPAIREAVAGRSYISPDVRSDAVERFLADGSLPCDPLLDKEVMVLRMIAEGKTTRAIAEMLHITTKSAETYRVRLMNKLHVHDVAGLVRYAVRRGVIDAGIVMSFFLQYAPHP
jgi:DNA-binding NarL/FixJ family response regulator